MGDPPIRYYKVRDSQSMSEQIQSHFLGLVENFCDGPVTNDPSAASHIYENRRAPSPLVCKNAYIFFNHLNIFSVSWSQALPQFYKFLKMCRAPSPLVCKKGNVFEKVIFNIFFKYNRYKFMYL